MEKAKPRYGQIILMALLAGVTAFSLFKYFYTLKEKYELSNTIIQIRAQVAALETDKQSLTENLNKEKEISLKASQENTALTQDIKATKEKIDQLTTDIEYARKVTEDLQSQVAILKAENMAVREQNTNLTADLAQVSRQKEELSQRLSSIAELKKAIRELKIQMRKVRSEIHIKEEASGRVLEGNRGFLIKDGKVTYPTKVKIEVKSLPSNN